jgi:hypothetical protein
MPIPLRRRCRQDARLLLEQEEGPLPGVDRLALGLHLLTCQACTRFAGQLSIMRQATHAWRQYHDTVEDQPTPAPR